MRTYNANREHLDYPPLTRLMMMRAVFLLVSVLSALLLGYWIGVGSWQPLSIFAVVAVVGLVSTGLQQNAWVLIPLMWALAGSIPLLPLPFSARHLAILLVLAAYIGYRVLVRASERVGWVKLDLLVGMNLLWLLMVYVRHPSGFRAFGSESIGGRPYVEAGFSALAYWLLVRLPNADRKVAWIPWLLLAGCLFTAGLQAAVYIKPSLTPMLASFYSTLDTRVYLGGGIPEVWRLYGLADVGLWMFLVLCAYFSPRTLLNPLRWPLYLALTALCCILASGFRNVLLSAVMGGAVSAFCHRGWRELVPVAIVSGLLLAVVVLGQGRWYRLPLSVQRTLSFLPGDWSPTVLADTETSSRWRFELWRTILRENWIKDPWLGDGIGYTAKSLETVGGSGGMTADVAFSGAYHNGPLTTMHCVGVVGTVFFYALLIGAAVDAVRCVRRSRRTPLFPLAVLLSSWLVWLPFHYSLIFGSFEVQLPELVMMAGLLRLLIRMLDKQALETPAGTSLASALTGGTPHA
jgi:hypothetical protein